MRRAALLPLAVLAVLSLAGCCADTSCCANLPDDTPPCGCCPQWPGRLVVTSRTSDNPMPGTSACADPGPIVHE